MLNQSAELDRLFHALADPARRAMVERLAAAGAGERAGPAAAHVAALGHATSGRIGGGGPGAVGKGRPGAHLRDRAPALAKSSTGSTPAGSNGPRLDRLGDVSRNPGKQRRWRWLGSDVKRTPARRNRRRSGCPACSMLPAETVFRAWSSAEHVERWFEPGDIHRARRQVEMRVGGPFEVCMRSPAGEEHWTRGVFVEVTPHAPGDRHARRGQGRQAVFRAYTEVDFSDALAARGWTCCKLTRLSIHQRRRRWSRARRKAGARPSTSWRRRSCNAGRNGRRPLSVAHATFHLARTYDAPVALVWKALTDEAAKQKWFRHARPMGAARTSHGRARGGKERLKGRWEGGVVSTFDAVYHDVIPQREAGLQL